MIGRASRLFRSCALTQVAVVAVLTSPVLGQSLPARSFVASLGPSFYRLSDRERGTGIVTSASLRWRLQGRMFLIAGPALWSEQEQVLHDPFPVWQTRQQFITDIGLEFSLPLARIHPFVGGGAGLILGSGVLPTGYSPYGALGAHWRLSGAVGLRAEARVRGVGPTQGRTVEPRLGITLNKP